MYMTTDVVFNGASTKEGTGVVNSMTLGATGLVEVLHCKISRRLHGNFRLPDTPQVSLQAREVAQQAFDRRERIAIEKRQHKDGQLCGVLN
jgi:hypothetical protein